MFDDSILRQAVRAAIDAGKLPTRGPDRTYGGPGSGSRCTICDATIRTDEAELELEFAKDGLASPDTHHVHARCYVILNRERRNLAPNVGEYGSLPDAAAGDYKLGRGGTRPFKTGPA